jgi:hypothetical protein
MRPADFDWGIVPETGAPLGTTTVLPTIIGLDSDASNCCFACDVPLVIGAVVRTLSSVPAGITTGFGVGVGVGGATGAVSLAADSAGGAGLYHAFDFGAEDGAAGGALLWAGGCEAAVSGAAVSGEEVAVGWGVAAFCASLAL